MNVLKEIIHDTVHTAGATVSGYLLWLLKHNKINIMKTIDAKTFLHGLLIAILSPIIPGIVISFNQGTIPTGHQFLVLGLSGLGAGLTYVLKNLFLGSGMPTANQAAPVIILFLMLFAGSVKGQANSLIQMNGSKWGTQGDTIINTGTSSDSALMSNAFATGSIVTYITKISGTVSPTIILQGSVDGHAWTTFGEDTLVLSNATGTVNKTWICLTPLATAYHGLPPVLPFLYVRVFATGTGTMKAIIKSWIAPR